MRSFLCSLARSSRPSSCQLARHWTRQPIRTLVSAADLQFGQPLYETHPHLLRPGELTPGISALEYAERRARLAASLPPNSIAILASADVKARSGTVFYKFHQEPDFLYLTGFIEPDSIAVIEKGQGTAHNFHLYCRPKDPKNERWEGSRSGVQAAQDVFNADEASDVDNVLTILSNVIGGRHDVYTDIPMQAQAKPTFTKIIFRSAAPAVENIGELLQKSHVKPLRPFMNELRATKSDAEIACMRKAGQASGQAFTDVMDQHFHSERDLDMFLDYRFKRLGCEESAYVPVIAGGENALQIHYVRNDDVLRDGELVTVDAGGEYGGYVTDITRAWPVNGKFTTAQKDLYQMVLEVQKACLSVCREDAMMSLDGLHNMAETGLRDGLRNLGFNLSNIGLEALFPHHVGHYLGLAVHDAPGHTRTARLKQNQVITIEPGIYVEDDDRWPVHFRGMGIRIEDSVCIGASSPYVLTTEAVKEVKDIEALRA